MSKYVVLKKNMAQFEACVNDRIGVCAMMGPIYLREGYSLEL